MSDKQGPYHLVNSEDFEESHGSPSTITLYQMTSTQYGVVSLLILSCALNFWLTVDKLTCSAAASQLSSKYAGLAYNTLRPIQHSTEFSSSNQTRVQELWDNINFDKGMIYILPEHANSLELPPAQNFPWDPKLKIYLLNGYHNLHCLQSIQQSLVDLDSGKSLRYSMAHVMHCLDTLRDDILCHADDTPRYTTSSPRRESGMGQIRQCRDWEKLEAWAQQYSGCWRYIDVHQDRRSELERWRFCEPGSPYYGRVQRWIKKHQAELS